MGIQSMREPLPPLVLNLAPTGMTPTRARSSRVPLQPAEIIADVLAAADLGVTVVHLHARGPDDRPTHAREVYGRIIAGIRERRPDLVLCVSCSGRGGLGFAERAEALDLDGDLKPDMASLTLSSLNFADSASVNAPEVVVALAERMVERGIRPELEVFDLGMANMITILERRGLIRPPHHVNLLFAGPASAQARLLDIAAVVAALPSGCLWSLAGLGAAQLPMAAVAVGVAAGVRVGLEDNLWFDCERQRQATNVGLVERVHGLCAQLGRVVMKPEEFRSRLGMEHRSA
jgi:3-keto-5-aminohexanoate cleavage enzyme